MFVSADLIAASSFALLLALLVRVVHRVTEIVDSLLSIIVVTLDTSDLVANPTSSIAKCTANIRWNVADVLLGIVEILLGVTAHVLWKVFDALLVAIDVLIGTVVVALCCMLVCFGS